MSLKKNIIYLHFKGKHLITSKSQYQYNYGQYLYFTDLNLPQAFEVHFSNKERGESETQIGSNKLVEIPDKYFWSGALEIYAWVYLHNETNDGETIYEVRIPLIKRARPTDKEPLPDQQSAIDKAIAELNNALNITNENADKTNADKTQVATIKEEVATLKEEIDSTANAVSQDAQSADTAAERSEQSAQNSAESERKALDYSDEAKDYAQSALESKNTASQKAQVATNASAEAKDFRDEAETFKNEAEQIKQNVVDYRNETKGYRDEALTAKNDAQDSANAVQKTSEQMTQAGAEIIENVRDVGSRYATQAETAASNAQTSAESASVSATASAQSASQSAQIKADVEELKRDAQAAANSSGISARASGDFASQAQGYATSASQSAASAQEYASQAQTSANTASTKAQDASGYASTASTKATEASQSATNASQSAQTAEQAKTASQTAQGLAESARDSAVSAKTDAESARDDAETARDEAQQTVASISGALAEKAPVITDTASGSIASFTDGADDIPLKSLVVDIDPVQDLHGYDSPWVGGGGKNKFNTDFSDKTMNNTVITKLSDGKVSTSGVPTSPFDFVIGTVTLSAGDYILNGCPVGGGSGKYRLQVTDFPIRNNLGQDSGSGVSFTLSEEMTVAVRIQVYTGAPASLTFAPMIRLASVADASFAPYENICPISGWTEVDVEQSGVNVWDEEWEAGTYDMATGEPVEYAGYFRSQNPISVVPNHSYYFYTGSSAVNGIYLFFYEMDGTYIGNAGMSNSSNFVYSMPSKCRQLRFVNIRTNTYDKTTAPFSINYPSTDHSYHPYTGRSITIDLGQTVYGGHLDVLSGELAVYPYYASYNGETLTGEWISDRDKYVAGATPTIGAQVVNIGAQGVTVQLSANQLNSLYGVNNIWADSGDTTCVYRADTKAYIAKKIAEAISALS